MNWDLKEIGELAKKWEKACRSAQADAIVSLLSEDATVWYNTDPREHGREDYRKILVDSYQGFRNPEYHDFRVMLHPGGWVEQATLIGETDGGKVSMPFCLIATVHDGKIIRLEEYF